MARNQEKSDLAVKSLIDEGIAAYAVSADLTREYQVVRAVAEIVDKAKAIHILVNNAGTTVRKPPHEVSLDEWRQVLDVNLTSAFLMAKACYPWLKKAGGGKVINIGSLMSIFGGSYAPAYAASKGGIVQLTKSQALAWAADNIQANAILPGWIDTELTQGARRRCPASTSASSPACRKVAGARPTTSPAPPSGSRARRAISSRVLRWSWTAGIRRRRKDAGPTLQFR